MNELQQRTACAIVNVFETGRISGDYAAIAVMKGDSGHLSYGRSQAALGSGSLYNLLMLYCQDQAATYKTQLEPFMPRVQQRDITLDVDTSFRDLLKQAGWKDPAMRRTQDKFFNDGYFMPACVAAQRLGISEPLGVAVVYDSHVQGGWAKLAPQAGHVVAGNVRQWVGQYIDLRRNWLSSLKDPLPATVYRMDTFKSLIAAGNWDLELPLAVHGTQITQAALEDSLPTAQSLAAGPRNLMLATPYMRGDDVSALQATLKAKGLPVGQPDGVYGPFTDKLVAQWQRSQNPPISEAGAGPRTRASLGM